MTSVADTLRVNARRSITERGRWYSDTAQDYARTRPRYPAHLVSAVRAVAGLGARSRLLEIGSGPATATEAFLALGCRIDCVEPNPAFCAMLREACPGRRVRVHEMAFEDWPAEEGVYDAVLAASSLHWLNGRIALPKAASALKPGGHLVLLWNKELRLLPAAHEAVAECYARHAPELHRRETIPEQQAVLSDLAAWAQSSGHFRLRDGAAALCTVRYSVEDYLAALGTYSPYVALPAAVREALFGEIGSCLKRIAPRGAKGLVQLSYLSAYQVFALA